MTNIATPVAAWYPDPARQSDLRWWDGTGWTAEVRSSSAPPASAPVRASSEDRAALYAARREEHFTESSQAPQRTALLGPSSATSSETPDRFRVAFEEKTYQSWRKNKAATSALVFAGINLALLVYAFFEHYSPYYRIVPSVIGIAAASVALRQARETETGRVKSVIALVVNVVVGGVAAFAVLQLVLGLSAAVGDDVNEFLDTPNAVYSNIVENSIQAYAAEDQGQSVIAVDCPDSMRREVGEQYTCTETLGDGSTVAVQVRVTSTEGAFEYAIGEIAP